MKWLTLLLVFLLFAFDSSSAQDTIIVVGKVPILTKVNLEFTICDSVYTYSYRDWFFKGYELVYSNCLSVSKVKVEIKRPFYRKNRVCCFETSVELGKGDKVIYITRFNPDIGCTLGIIIGVYDARTGEQIGVYYEDTGFYDR